MPADGELQADLPRLVRHQGEPFGSTSIYAQYRVFQLARENGIKVMLEGQGADEVLAGYIVYQGARLASLLRQGAWRRARSFLARSARQHPQRPPRLLLQYAGLMLLPHAPAALLRRLSGRAIIPPWLNAAWFAERDVAVGPSAAPIGSHGLQVRNHLKVALRESLTAGLPRLLRHGDRNAMAFSIENRVPFLTVELVEFLLTLPEFYLLSDRGVSKHVLREAFRGIVPDEVLDRRDKVGFVTSQARWLTQGQGWLDERLRRAEEFDLFDGPGLKALDPVRQSDFAWRICNLVEWCDIFGVAVPAAVRSRRSNLRTAA
jgi:asparagine synthase (glutamine-hydrolysing)